MRVLFCKSQCSSFICFCKPSPHLYTAGPLKLENSPHEPSTVVSPSEVKEEEILDEKQDQEQDEDGILVDDCPKSKSCLKKVKSHGKEVKKKKVQWMDFLGKELVEIREFKSNQKEEFDCEDEYNRSCVCTIL